MCEIISIGDSTAFICGGEKDHECNELGVMYQTITGEQFFFTDMDKEKEWYDKNYQDCISGSVACTICGHAAIYDAYKL